VLTGEVTLFGFRTRAEAVKHADKLDDDVYIATVYAGMPYVDMGPVGFVIVPAQFYEPRH